ncbi:hypothetical protein [Leisingera methylohalidivorans]|uniref:Uncharacterized protein n=1 Tax=Leisingera methylohalidivorans DSM 14336 TaxID=999552 RepID=V9VZ13_9RHOB|nr:hypothetical protein [Leisingera methylohalidivorans]AHD03009.1 hypothetical protein METH_08635 [Leisingera methylohalidivorans DSM 14336]
MKNSINEDDEGVILTKAEIFDSWATRFGALAILTAAQKVFESLEAAKAGILFGVFVLSASCFVRIFSWSRVALRDMWSASPVKFFSVGLIDFSISLSLLLSTIAITFYNFPDVANLITHITISTGATIADAARVFMNFVVLPSLLFIGIVYAVVKWWRSE